METKVILYKKRRVCSIKTEKNVYQEPLICAISAEPLDESVFSEFTGSKYTRIEKMYVNKVEQKEEYYMYWVFEGSISDNVYKLNY